MTQQKPPYPIEALYGTNDEKVLAEIDYLIHSHRSIPPYSRNVLIRIKTLVDKQLGSES